MASVSIFPPYPAFADLAGKPLENGYIWIGTANLDPQVNPIPVYWDVALTIPAVQPIRTSGGYASRSGTPSQFFIASSTYSIRVQDKNGITQYQAADGSVGGILVNPMTDPGDIIVGGLLGVPERLGIGTNGQVLTVVNNSVAWANSSQEPIQRSWMGV